MNPQLGVKVRRQHAFRTGKRANHPPEPPNRTPYCLPVRPLPYPMPDTATPDLRTLLRDAQTIAVVGLSDRPSRTSYAIAQYLQRAGYRIIPVNPYADEVLGAKAYPDVASIPAETQVDIVNVFRRSDKTAGVVRDTAARTQATGQQPAIWTQLGVSSADAEQEAADAGLPYIANRCIMVDHRSLL